MCRPSKYMQPMQSGYSGHVPNRRNHIGTNFSSVASTGFARLHRSKERADRKQMHLLATALDVDLSQYDVAPPSHRMPVPCARMESGSESSSRSADMREQHVHVEERWNPDPVITPRVKYSRGGGVVPGTTIHIPERNALQVGKVM